MRSEYPTICGRIASPTVENSQVARPPKNATFALPEYIAQSTYAPATISEAAMQNQSIRPVYPAKWYAA